MAYSDYTLLQIEENFGIKNQVVSLFERVESVEPSDWLLNLLQIAKELPLRSEKAKSEMIVMPILVELRNTNDKYFTIYSGEQLNVDDKLKGECDFIISKDTHTFDVNYPIVQVVEAKKNDVEIGVPQCAAQMLGAKKYNEKRGNMKNNIIYGCVTTGDNWLFMRLTHKIEIDNKKYYLGNLNQLLGVFQSILNDFKQAELSANI
jgi:hypothetical protein